MTPTPLTPDERLSAALQKYQTALDLGLPVDRSALLARHADLPDLADHIQTLDALHGAVADLAPGPQLPPPADPTLADFEIVREAGRGGMGVVYEAVQRSLGRRVAVKVLTRAATLDDRARRRFLHESRATALVDHPNVVPVFHVGEEHGVPYYVMPFINGPSLAAVLAAPPESAPGPARLPAVGTAERHAFVARVGRQAAAALAAAHALGVVHRDIKPANLLLGPGGKVWVTDFGLALAPFAAGLTQTGGLPGTPRYMSPEQLSGPRDRVDARTDVYSLGVSLYELATGRLAFPDPGEAELRKRIAAGLPPPTGVPADLATVVGKATAPDPADRYQTAAALADDLDRFLTDRPVLARRPGLVTIGRKWAVRHRRGISLVAAGVVGGLVVALGVAVQAYRAEAAARAEAERNRSLAVAAVGTLGNASDILLSHSPGLEGAQVQFLTESRDAVEPFAADEALPPAVRRNVIWASFRLGQAYMHARRFADAEAAFRTALGRLEPLAAAAPTDATLQRDLAQAHQWVGQSLHQQKRHADGRTEYGRALGRAEEAYRIDPEAASVLATLSEIRLVVASLDESTTGFPAAALPTYLDVAKVYEALRDRYPTGHPRSYMRLVFVWDLIAQKNVRLGRPAEAERAFGKAVAADTVLAADFRNLPANVREGCWHVRGEWGRLKCGLGRADEGLPMLRDSVRELEQAVRRYPETAHYRSRLAVNLGHLAAAERLFGDPAAVRTTAARCGECLATVDLTYDAEEIGRVWSSALTADLRSAALGQKLLTDVPSLSSGDRAAVLYRLGRPAEALALLSQEGEPTAEFVRVCCLATTNRSAARAAYELAARRLAAEPIQLPEAQLWQREAAEAAGLPVPK